jgi:hypothetical protein
LPASPKGAYSWRRPRGHHVIKGDKTGRIKGVRDKRGQSEVS